MFYSAQSSWRPNEELQRILDKCRSARLNHFKRSWMANMTIEQAIAEYKKEGMYCTNLYERREGGWNCYLRYETNGLLAESGFGESAQEAIFDALTKARKHGFDNRDLSEPKKPLNGLAGIKTPEDLTQYGAPLASQLPRDIGKSDDGTNIVPELEPVSDCEFDTDIENELLGPTVAVDDDFADLL